MSDGSEPITDHEILYRRIPASSGLYDLDVDSSPSPLAFRPTQFDTTGLSLSRAKYKTLEQAGQGREGIEDVELFRHLRTLAEKTGDAALKATHDEGLKQVLKAEGGYGQNFGTVADLMALRLRILKTVPVRR